MKNIQNCQNNIDKHIFSKSGTLELIGSIGPLFLIILIIICYYMVIYKKICYNDYIFVHSRNCQIKPIEESIC